MEAIVLAGGFGTRLAARLKDIPKPMAPVAGRPFLEILLGQLARAGCTRALLSVGHLHTVIQNHFGGGFCGLRIEYAIEASPLGTGGAIRSALRLAEEDSVLVLNGDTFLDADYDDLMRFHKMRKTPLTMAITHRDDIARYGGVTVENGRIVDYREKGSAGPGWINAGAYAIDRELEWPQNLPESFSFEKDFLMSQVHSLMPAAYAVNGFFLDIGVPEDLDRAQTELAGYY